LAAKFIKPIIAIAEHQSDQRLNLVVANPFISQLKRFQIINLRYSE
jgi:hypothetical protein